jgi:hypothetical protein
MESLILGVFGTYFFNDKSLTSIIYDVYFLRNDYSWNELFI